MASKESSSSDESCEKRSSSDKTSELGGKLSKLKMNEKDITPKQKKSQNSSKAAGAKRRLDLHSASPSTSSHLANGEWFKAHPWESRSPLECMENKMAPNIVMSEVYTLSSKWCIKDKKEVDMEKIYSNLPTFIMEMKMPSSREALQCLLKDYKRDFSSNPHITEIIEEQEGVKPGESKDKPSKRTEGKEEEERFKAFSSPFHEGKYCYLDCEYMLKMFLPDVFDKWFKVEEENRIRAIEAEAGNKRWIFTPSYRRAKIALLGWPEDKIITQDSTIRILVVRPYEFEKYVEHHGQRFPIISLPQEEIGAGYARFWIQKIALHLRLQFIWMIDDSVECFYEYHPEVKPTSSYREERRRKFGLVFTRIEELVKDSQAKGAHPIAAMSPKRFTAGRKVKNPFACSPPRIAVFLNLQLLNKKEVYYRPELQVYEDMVFGYECEKKGLKVFIDNRIHLQDHIWKNTGARSASITQKQTKA